MGLYQLVFSVYILASTFAISGISTGVTRLIAEQAGQVTRNGVRRVMWRAIALSVIFGLLSALIIISCAEYIARYALGDMRAVPALQILSAGLPFMGVSSCIRGYFIARRRVSDSMGAQLFEQFVRITVIVLIINKFASKGIGMACAAVMVGDALAQILSCGYIAVSYILDKRKLPTVAKGSGKTYSRILRKLLTISLPVSAGRYLNTALHTVENLLVPNCLSKFSGSRRRALSQFGMLKGMALPILFFPASFLAAFSTLLITEISEASALRQSDKVKRAANQTMRLTLFLSIPVSALFMALSKQLGVLVYNSEEVGFLIGVLAPITPFMYLESVVDGLLKGLDQQVSSLKYNMFNSAVRIGSIILMVPTQGMRGFLLIMIVSNILTSTLNVRRLLQVTGLHMQWGQWVFKPLLAIASSVVASRAAIGAVYSGALSSLPAVSALSIAALVFYVILLFLFGCINARDFTWLTARKKAGTI